MENSIGLKGVKAHFITDHVPSTVKQSQMFLCPVKNRIYHVLNCTSIKSATFVSIGLNIFYSFSFIQ